MNRRVLTALSLSLITVFAIQYFTKKEPPAAQAGAAEAGKVQQGQFYSAPVKQVWHREPKREIDFVDKKVTEKEETQLLVETDLYSATFSSFGGVLQSLSFKNHKGKSGAPLETIKTNLFEQREEGCFLLAFDEKTPFAYSLESQEKTEDYQVITYATKSDDWLIRKTYTLNNTTYKVDLQISFEPTKSNPEPLNPRLFFPAPHVFEVADNVISGLVTKDGVRIDKVPASQELGGVWGIPEVFGAEDKYFAHTMVGDSSSFIQGGYFKRVNRKLFSILEGTQVTAKKQLSLSFYMGPKLLSDLSIVDARLVDLLSFGWLSWICKMLLRLLEFLFKHLGNFGLAVIALAILLKLPFVPMSIVARRKMEEYQKFQPTINRIRQKYRSDMKKQQEEIMLFHKEHNLSPTTPMVGCLPLLIQLPILFAFYKVLGNYLSLYQAPFFGWLHDLSASDPYYVLPILMGATMLWQQTMSPMTDQKQRMMMMFMPVVMTAIFINFPAGIVLYWLTNNILTVGEDLLRKKIFS